MEVVSIYRVRWCIVVLCKVWFGGGVVGVGVLMVSVKHWYRRKMLVVLGR